MDLRRLRAGEWLMGVAGAALFAVLFVDWYRPEGGGAGLTAWQAFSVPDVLLALLAVAAMATIALVARAPTAAPGIAYEAMILLGGIIGSVICLIRVVDVPADGLEVRPGAWVGLLVALGLCASCLVAMRDERRSTPDRTTDGTGVPVAAAPAPEDLPAPPA